MGMYDSVMVPCPTCGESADFQSKSGNCNLETFALDEAPDNVLLGVNRHAPMHCRKCGTKYHVAITGPRRTLTARSVVWNPESVDE
jgi:hypothetical protein